MLVCFNCQHSRNIIAFGKFSPPDANQTLVGDYLGLCALFNETLYNFSHQIDLAVCAWSNDPCIFFGTLFKHVASFDPETIGFSAVQNSVWQKLTIVCV